MNLIYKDEVYAIVGYCIEFWKTLGYGFSEIIYKDALEEEFSANQISYTRENELCVKYKGKKLRHKFRADFTLFDDIVIEVKSSDEGIADGTVSQILNYLKASGCRLGLIVNFSRRRLEYRRLIM